MEKRATVRHYRDLTAWQRAIDLVEAVYRLTRTWPDDERFGMIPQIRRAAVSIPANIAEGQGRTGTREFSHFVSVAHGSLMEVETYLVIATRLKYGTPAMLQEITNLATEVGLLVRGLLRSLR